MPQPTPQPTPVPLSSPDDDRGLPAHQVMDREALAWIMRNRPEFPAVPYGSLSHRAEMLIPQRTWFAVPALADSIHGIQHNARVSLLVSLLADEHGLDYARATALSAAAAIHDCRRRDDRCDPGHGWRAGSRDGRSAQGC